MFESALGRYEAARGRFGTGAVLSIAAHALVVGALLLRRMVIVPIVGRK